MINPLVSSQLAYSQPGINPQSQNIRVQSEQEPTPPKTEPVEPPAAQKGITLSITPSETNVSEGDKSQNSAQVTLTTPNNEFSRTVTREDAAEQIVSNIQQRAVERVVDSITPGRGDNNLLLKIGLANNPDITPGNGEIRETAVDVLETRARYDTAQFALNTAANNQNQYGSNTGNNNGTGFVQTVNQSAQFYLKSQLYFDTLDRAGERINDIGNQLSQTV